MPALAVRSVFVSFGGVRALDGAHLVVEPGEVHGLLGANGSGKSTLVKVLAGYHAPEPGAVLEVHGEPQALPLLAGQLHALRVGFVHQELGLIESLSVAENLFLPEFAFRRGRLSPAGMRARARAILAARGVALDAALVVNELDAADRARLAIVRALEQARGGIGRPGMLFLDEPTAFLPAPGRAWLFDLLREAASEGVGVVLVSHDVAEVLEVTDRVTVLRDGRNAGTLDSATSTGERLVRMIVGDATFARPVPAAPAPSPRLPAGTSVADVWGDAVRGVSFELRSGEVVGLTGVGGSGYEELPYLLCGARRARAGTLSLRRGVHPLPHMTPTQALREGIALVPGDRRVQGAALSLPVTDNVTLPVLNRYRRGRWLERRRMERDTAAAMRRWGVRPADPRIPFGALSGGNQQKALLGKWLESEPTLLLLDEPTRGVDVGSREEILAMIRAVAAGGATVLCASADHDQLCALCDRVLVLVRGVVVAEVERRELTKERIARLCYGDALSHR